MCVSFVRFIAAYRRSRTSWSAFHNCFRLRWSGLFHSTPKSEHHSAGTSDYRKFCTFRNKKYII